MNEPRAKVGPDVTQLPFAVKMEIVMGNRTMTVSEIADELERRDWVSTECSNLRGYVGLLLKTATVRETDSAGQVTRTPRFERVAPKKYRVLRPCNTPVLSSIVELPIEVPTPALAPGPCTTLAADYWDDDPLPESLVHTSLEQAVEYYVEASCRREPLPRKTVTPPPGHVSVQLSTTPSEAWIAARIAKRTERFLECLRVLEPRVFYGWKRSTVDHAMVAAIASNLAETTVCYELEELRDPDGLQSRDRELMRRLEAGFAEVLQRELIDGPWTPWHCDRVGEVRLTGVQMEAMMREHRPDWFAV